MLTSDCSTRVGHVLEGDFDPPSRLLQPHGFNSLGTFELQLQTFDILLEAHHLLPHRPCDRRLYAIIEASRCTWTNLAASLYDIFQHSRTTTLAENIWNARVYT